MAPNAVSIHSSAIMPPLRKRKFNNDENEFSDDENADFSPKSGSPSLDDDRRAHHNELERRRRDHIKDHFLALKNTIPLLEGEKSSRALILKRAVDYITHLQSQLKESKNENEDLKRNCEQLRHAATLSIINQSAAAAVAAPAPPPPAPVFPTTTSTFLTSLPSTSTPTQQSTTAATFQSVVDCCLQQQQQQPQPPSPISAPAPQPQVVVPTTSAFAPMPSSVQDVSTSTALLSSILQLRNLQQFIQPPVPQPQSAVSGVDFGQFRQLAAQL